MDNKLGMRTFVIKASLYSEKHICKNYFEQIVAIQISATTHTTWEERHILTVVNIAIYDRQTVLFS